MSVSVSEKIALGGYPMQTTVRCLLLREFWLTAQFARMHLKRRGLTMAEPKKPFSRDKKWKLGRSFGWWHIPYCPHCKRQLGLMGEEQKAEKCPMCGKPLEWDGAENG